MQELVTGMERLGHLDQKLLHLEKNSIGEAAGRALDMHTPPTQVKCGLELQLF